MSFQWQQMNMSLNLQHFEQAWGLVPCFEKLWTLEIPTLVISFPQIIQAHQTKNNGIKITRFIVNRLDVPVKYDSTNICRLFSNKKLACNGKGRIRWARSAGCKEMATSAYNCTSVSYT